MTGGLSAGSSLALGLRLLDSISAPVAPVFPEPLLCPDPQPGWHYPSICFGILLGLALGPVGGFCDTASLAIPAGLATACWGLLFVRPIASDRCMQNKLLELEDEVGALREEVRFFRTEVAKPRREVSRVVKVAGWVRSKALILLGPALLLAAIRLWKRSQLQLEDIAQLL